MRMTHLEITVGILTVSDRASLGIYQDQSGPALQEQVSKNGWQLKFSSIVPDSRRKIEKILFDWSDKKRLSLILTTGGTGVGPRDVTPEATQKIIEKELPGIAELMRWEGLKETPLALLSRSAVGVRKQTLIVNLPGSPKGALCSLRAISHLVPHILAMLGGGKHD